jgi:hypothetical protein
MVNVEVYSILVAQQRWGPGEDWIGGRGGGVEVKPLIYVYILVF